MPKLKKTGKCHICGNVGQLSYEHVPPASAFNKTKARLINATEILGRNDKLPWDIEGVKVIEQQRGRGGYTLCEACNNFTGHTYAKEYVHMVQLATDGSHSRYIRDGTAMEIALDEVYPLRFAKQVLTMFASTNGPGFFDAQPELRRLVMDKNATGIDKNKYALYVYYMTEGLGRNTGIAAWGDFAKGTSFLASEMSAPPFGFVLELNPKREEHGIWGAEITPMFNEFGYNDKTSIGFRMPKYEQNTPLPCDFRTKDEIAKLRTDTMETTEV
jgi:hypothetical protein